MAETVRDTIKRITKSHLERGNHLFSQNVAAVGWLAGTLFPDSPNIVELPTSDSANGAMVVGASLFERPIYVIRFQGFSRLNLPFIQSYAAKSKEMSGVPCPIFIRAMAVEGLIGPVATNSHHSLAYREPGIKIAAPMTPQEYEDVYNEFMAGDDPLYCSEHRGSYDNSEELKNIDFNEPDLILFPFSVTRFETAKAAKILNQDGLKISVFHQNWIRPLKITDYQIEKLKKSKFGGIILDDDYENGVAKNISAELMLKTEKPVRTLCIENRTAGFARRLDNLPPDADKIYSFVKKIINEF